MGDQGFRPAYHVQVATTRNSQVSVGEMVLDAVKDMAQLAPMVEQVTGAAPLSEFDPKSGKKPRSGAMERTHQYPAGPKVLTPWVAFAHSLASRTHLSHRGTVGCGKRAAALAASLAAQQRRPNRAALEGTQEDEENASRINSLCTITW
jgi:hypothetical protein